MLVRRQLLPLLVRRRLLLLFFAAFALRVAAVLVIREYERPNTWESGMVADALLRGHGFAIDWRTMLGTPPEPNVASTWWPPAYPLFLAACRLAAPASPWLLASILQAALLALVSVLLYHTGRLLFGETAGWIAALYAVLQPSLSGYAALIQTAAFEIFWLSLALFLATRAMTGAPRLARRDAFLAGLAAAVGALTRGPVLFLLLIAPIAWLAARLGARRVLSLAALLLAGAALLLGPWAARNYHVRGTFILLSSKGGWNLFMGNNPVPALSTPWDQKRAIQPPLREELMRMNEVEGNRALRRLALDYVRAHPRETLQNVMGRAKHVFWFNEEFGKRSGYSSVLGKVTRPVYMVTWPILLVLALAGVVLTAGDWRRLVLYYGMIAAIAGVILLTFFQNRFRAPLEPILILFAAAALAKLRARLVRR